MVNAGLALASSSWISVNKLSASPALSTRPCKPASPNRGGRIIQAMMGADPIRDWICSEGGASKITRISPVGGGCINTALRYDTDAQTFFVKTNRDVGPAMFEAEAAGLHAMFATETIRVPKPFKVGALPGRGSYIIMEYINMGTSRGGQAELGRQLAQMHKAGSTDKGFGFDMDNTIGSTPQPNPWMSDWVAFFQEQRLRYQLQLAEKQYRDYDIAEKGQRLVDKLPSLFQGVGEIKPCLLHGDLWSGNIAADEKGAPVILDPACYYGHSEAEFGMSWCAGFGSSFYNAYFDVIPKQPGFEQRRDLILVGEGITGMEPTGLTLCTILIVSVTSELAVEVGLSSFRFISDSTTF
ncbi:hypothetical protein R1sor_013907 [Riccia sorocarpa]|uniref:protein-ribulosamine 3-kinase n=1 Tax=Riccia sorocarpa TaxID=122646 RepID=A0ABD3H824_9MARC